MYKITETADWHIQAKGQLECKNAVTVLPRKAAVR